MHAPEESTMHCPVSARYLTVDDVAPERVEAIKLVACIWGFDNWDYSARTRTLRGSSEGGWQSTHVPGAPAPLDYLEDLAEHMTRELAAQVWHANGGAYAPIVLGVEMDAADGEGHHDAHHLADEDVYRAVMQRDARTGETGYFDTYGDAVDPERIVAMTLPNVGLYERELSDALFAYWNALGWSIDERHWARLGNAVHAWFQFDWDQVAEAGLDGDLVDDGAPLRVPGYGATAEENAAFAAAMAERLTTIVARAIGAAGSMTLRVVSIADRTGKAVSHEAAIDLSPAAAAAAWSVAAAS
jgi:hypothetical protein